MKIAFIGGGNMGEAMLAAVLEDGLAKPESVWVSDVSPTRRKALVQKYGVAAMAGNREAISGKEIVVLAVKPQNLAEVDRQPPGSVAGPDRASGDAADIGQGVGLLASDVEEAKVLLATVVLCQGVGQRPGVAGQARVLVDRC